MSSNEDRESFIESLTAEQARLLDEPDREQVELSEAGRQVYAAFANGEIDGEDFRQRMAEIIQAEAPHRERMALLRGAVRDGADPAYVAELMAWAASADLDGEHGG